MKTPGKLKQLSVAVAMVLGVSAVHALEIARPVPETEKAAPFNVMQSKIIAFTDDQVPDYVHAGSGSALSISDKRYVIGDQSLRWDWKSGSTMTVIDPIRLVTDNEAWKTWGRRATQVLSFWVYNEKPVDDVMIVDLGRGLNGHMPADAGFEVNMNFSGWRTVGVSLQNDIQGREMEGLGIIDRGDDEGLGLISQPGGIKPDMDSIRFTAPSGVDAGTFYIDRIMLSVDDARYQWSDDHVKTRITVPEIDFALPDQLPEPTAEELAGVRAIHQALTQVFASEANETGLKKVNDQDQLRQMFADLNIEKDEDGTLRGRHILSAFQRVIYQQEHLTPDDKALVDEYVLLADYSSLMLNIARQWNSLEPGVEKDEFKAMYLSMVEHLMDQGFADGSGLVTTHHWGYGSRWWYISAMMMSDILEEAGYRKAIYDALVWYSREFAASFSMDTGKESSNLDYYNTLARQHLALLLLNPDPVERVALMKKFGNFFNLSLAQTPPGYYDGLRPDGTAWRHDGNYPGYSFPAFNGAAQVVYMLKDSPFAVSADGRANLKRAMMAAWNYSNPSIGLGLAGRHPFRPYGVKDFSESFKWLALTGNPETGDTLDEELASTYLQVTGRAAAESQAIFGRQLEPMPLPEGHWTYNGGAFGIHRYNDKMVTLKAYNKDVWSSEIYYRDNRYGRYQSHGAVQIKPFGDQTEYGFAQEGWDWNRNPGATTIHLPLDQLNSPITHTLMLRGSESFSGSSNLEGQYGLFAFKHKAPGHLDRFDGSFVARKSTMAIDNRLIMLGSDISNRTSKYPTETTLFQHGIAEKSADLWVNGKKVEQLPFSATLKAGDWLIDGHDNGYYVIKGDEVNVRRQHQTSRHDKTMKPTEGDFSVAWIDHGKAPGDAGYEYLVLMDTTPEAMARLADDMKAGKKPYDVLRKDANAHVIKDNATQVTGYVAFSGGSFNEGVVSSISREAMVMTRPISDTEMTISAVTTDLGLTKETMPATLDIAVTIKGAWKAAEMNDKVKVATSGDSTSLVFSSYFGIPAEVKLIKVR
ncbi:chondroitinase family polysaccharide lyase [Endozoicomonas sp. SCSIO W0465]|uniref:chondroitinase family polysaccharide lyase n=1 Tax=Endozoicomonas sp. SCSIO W0465 TaxID=2918516 RepID=UPI0020750C5C|nr:chondroitinase family polysaccharide lyase [Endozoicomonas sp. SCSIO W0465]USE35110.1 chondroitin lyase [Endozoicomonas sp. SCSIO W0465]